MIEDPIVYVDQKDHRELDLRPDGIDAVPVLGLTRLSSVSPAPSQHIHPGCVEIVLCLRGIVTFEAGRARIPFLPGNVFVSTDTQPHALMSNPKGLTTYRVLFAVPPPGTRILGLAARESEWLVRSLTHLPSRCFRDSTGIRSIFRKLFDVYDTMRRGSVARRLKLKSLVIDLLLAVIESARSHDFAVPAVITAIAERIATQPQNPYKLVLLAAETGVALVTFSAMFKRATGLPPYAYIVHHRIRKACTLLCDPNLPIHVIADTLGFSSKQHFSAAFRRNVGVPPSVYRAEHLPPNARAHATQT